jgi:hypothetical protein
MLTVRSFRNEDPPRLLELWRHTQRCRSELSPLPPLSLNQLQAQILGLPMLDHHAVMLAFEDSTPVGYIHTTFAPAQDGHSLDYTTGQICFLCVDSTCFNTSDAAAALIQAGENYLSGLCARTIFGGSPSPSVPFYSAFYSGGEAVGILPSDVTAINAFHKANYQIHQATTWFHFDLRNYTPVVTAEMVGYYGTIEVEVSEIPKAKTWWEGCMLTNGVWFDATAFFIQTGRPVARLRTRITYPDTENSLTMYGENWLASLMELRVHSDFENIGIERYLLAELIRYLAAQHRIVHVEAHSAADSPLFVLLRSQSWQERDTGSVFIKTVK